MENGIKKTITYKGQTKTIDEWSEVSGIPAKRIWIRFRNKWDLDKLFNTPGTNGEWRRKLLTLNGETKTLQDWSCFLGIREKLIWVRLLRGASVEEALAPKKTIQKLFKNKIEFTLNGVTKTLEEWSKELGIRVKTLRWRINKGLPVEEILAPLKLKNKSKPSRMDMYTFNGETRTIKQWSESTGVPVRTIRNRIKLGKVICD